MHRTKAPGHLSNMFDYENTVIGSPWLNAVQEELCNLIELNGGTPNSEAQDEASGGRRNIYDMIYSGGKLTDAAIDELTFAVMSDGEIDITTGTYSWLQNVGELTLAETSGDSQNTISASRATVQANGVQAKYSGKGIQWSNGPEGTSPGWDTSYLRKTLVTVPISGSWADPDSLGVWRCPVTKTTDIPYATVYSVSARAYSEAEIGGVGGWINAPVICLVDNDGGYVRFSDIRVPTGDPVDPDITSLYLLVEYNAASLSV